MVIFCLEIEKISVFIKSYLKKKCLKLYGGGIRLDLWNFMPTQIGQTIGDKKWSGTHKILIGGD